MHVLLSLFACKPEATTPAVTSELDLWDPVAISVGSAVAVGEVELPLRAVNAFGVAVAAPELSVELQVQGQDLVLEQDSLGFDGLGYGLARISGPPQAFTVDLVPPQGLAVEGPGEAWLAGGDVLPLSLYPGWQGSEEPRFLEVVPGGWVSTQGNRLWWQDRSQRSLPQPLAELPEDLLGLAAGDIDADGVTDLLTWTSSAVVLLRGRAGGGYSWGAGFELPGLQVTGAALGDLSGDGNLDLAIVYDHPSDAGFQVLFGDGVWGFEAQTPYLLGASPWSVSVGDLGGDGSADLVILQEGSGGRGVVRRFKPQEESWYANGLDLGLDLDKPLEPGSGLMPTADLDGDGSDELVVYGPPGDASRVLAFYTFEGNPKEFELRDITAYRLALADLSGDDVSDLVVVVDDPLQLRMISSEAEETRFTNRSLGGVPQLGALGVGRVDGDDIPDVLIASTSVSAYPGRVLDGLWQVADDGFGSFGTTTRGPLLVTELDGDGWAEVIVVRDWDGTTVLQVFHVGEDAEGKLVLDSPSGHRLDVDDNDGSVQATGLDMAVCDGVVYLLVDDGGSWLSSVDIESTGRLALRRSLAVDATRLDCGEVAAGGRVVVADDSGAWQSYGPALVSQGAGQLGPLGDLALAELGSGGEPVACPDEGCRILAADLDGDGIDELITGGPHVAIEAWGQVFTPGLSGEPAVADYDGDGWLDLAFTDLEQDRVVVLTTVEGGFAPPVHLHSLQDISGPVQLADADGDGTPEAWFEGPEANLLRGPRSGN